VEIAIALSLEPRVLLLDEPTAGVPNSELGRLFDAIESLPDGLTMMLIEHDMQTVMRFATAISVMVEGTILMSGPPADVMASEEVRVIYLGKMRDGH
jgi:branched-chain amino acid transport system ATP-binding protein